MDKSKVKTQNTKKFTTLYNATNKNSKLVNPLFKLQCNHYKKSWFFKRFNLTKVFVLTKKMYALTKSMGHEMHMVFLVGSFDQNDYFEQMLSHTSSQKRQLFLMVHEDAHGLVKSAILNGHV